MSFKTRYITFLSQLEKIADTHDELTDTDARERLREVLNYHFIWEEGSPTTLPKRFAMFSPSADKKVAKVVHSFINDALEIAKAEGIAKGSARHALIEDENAVTDEGNSYEIFLGSSDRLMPATAPAPDKLFKHEKSSKNRDIPSPLDLTQLAVNVEGTDIFPLYNGEFSTYEYILPGGAMVAVSGKKLEDVRTSARRAVEHSLRMKLILRGNR